MKNYSEILHVRHYEKLTSCRWRTRFFLLLLIIRVFFGAMLTGAHLFGFTLKQSSKSNENNEHNHLICILGIQQICFQLDPFFSYIENDQNVSGCVCVCFLALSIRVFFIYLHDGITLMFPRTSSLCFRNKISCESTPLWHRVCSIICTLVVIVKTARNQRCENSQR